MKTCPFCLGKRIIKHGKRYNKKNINQIYSCCSCMKKWTEGSYRSMRYEDSVIDSFIELYENNNFESARMLRDLLELKTGVRVSHPTIVNWRILYRRGRLSKKYIPNSSNLENKLNPVKIAEIVDYDIYGKNVRFNYSKERREKILEELKKFEGRIVKAKIIRGISGTSKLTKPTDTFLIKAGVVEMLGNGFYYVPHRR